MIMILDVEGMQTAKPYNIGYLIADTKGNIEKKVSLAVLPSIWENLQNCLPAKEMTHKNIEEILKNPNKKYEWVDNEAAHEKFILDIMQYQIKEIWSYNVQFDRGAMSRLLGGKINIVNNCAGWYDIWTAIISTKLLTKKYIKWCKTNGYLTEKGNPKTSAEVVYKYLTNNLDFEEEHTGLADCEIEYQIYLAAKRTKKKLDGKTAQPWRLVKKFCEKNNLI